MRSKFGALWLLAAVVTLRPLPLLAEAPPAAASSAGGSVSSELFLKLQQMEQEILELRGRIEEQSHDIEQLKTRQKEHYLDFDRRINELKSPAAPAAATEAAPTSPAAAASQPPAPAATNPPATAPPAAAATGNAEEAYKSAYQLVKDRRFDEARSSFEAFVQRFPKGDYTANAYYWLGELYLLKSDWESARRAFTKVIGDYPQHPKTPDAMYKLGVAYHKMGQNDRAKEMLQKTRTIFPDSSAARLAEIYLREIK